MVFLLNKNDIEINEGTQEKSNICFVNITHLDRRAWHLPVNNHERSLYAIRWDAMRPKAICNIEGAVVTCLAHCVIRLQLEGVIAVQRRRTILTCSPTCVTFPVNDISNFGIDRDQTKVIVRCYYCFWNPTKIPIKKKKFYIKSLFLQSKRIPKQDKSLKNIW